MRRDVVRWGMLVGLLLGAAPVLGDEPPADRLKIVSPKPMGIIAIALNSGGDLLGFEWADDPKNEGVLEQRPFLARGKDVTYLPLLPTYTATLPAALADDGTVAGRAGKPAPPGVRVHLRNQAFVWDAKAGIRGLGALPGDVASFATGISRDGRRIAGFSVGDNRVRACVWDRQPEGDAWKPTEMPHEADLRSNVVALSPDGRLAAAVDGLDTCLWTRGDGPEGRWTREPIAKIVELVPRAINDSGVIAGVRTTTDGYSHAVVWTRATGCQDLPKPPGFVKSEAHAVNASGVVVGMVDGPNGSPLGPFGFVYRDGKFRIITEGGRFFTTATTINDRGEAAGVLEEPEVEEPPAKPDPGAKKEEPEKARR